MRTAQISRHRYTLRDLKDHIFVTPLLRNAELYFKVFTFEASAGKTQTVCDTLKQLHQIDPHIKTLIVTKLIDEQQKLKENLGNIAFVINHTTKNVDEKALVQHPVLIITHERYKQLCRDEKRRQYYVEGRDLLIIDEQLDILDILEYSASKAEKITITLKNAILPKKDEDLCQFFGEIVNPLNDAVTNNYQKKMKFVYIEDERIQQKIEYLIKLINKAKFPNKTPMKKAQVIAEIQKIAQFFNNHHVIACNSILYTYNSVDYFLLKNNILLDASGKFLHLYRISDKFSVFDAEREIQHTNTTLTFINENSTTTAINKDEEKYYRALIEYIKKHTTKTDKVLIIGRDDDEEYISSLLNNNVQFVNFDSMRGRNDWSDYNKCFIIHLPNDQFYKYALQYLYYTRKDLKQSDLEINKIDTNHGFVNNIELEKLRITDVVSSIYQGLKRVNRINTAENQCELYVVTNNKWVQDLLVEQFKGLKQVRHDKLFERATLTHERILNLRDFLLSLQPGDRIKKEQVRELLGISTRCEFNKVLKALGGKDFLSKIGIKEERYYFIKEE